MKCTLFLVAALALGINFPNVAAATPPANSPTIVPTAVYAGYTNGAVYVDGFSGMGCSNTHLVAFLPSDGDPAKVFSLAMAALLSGKTIVCQTVLACTGNYARGANCTINQ